MNTNRSGPVRHKGVVLPDGVDRIITALCPTENLVEGVEGELLWCDSSTLEILE